MSKNHTLTVYVGIFIEIYIQVQVTITSVN